MKPYGRDKTVHFPHKTDCHPKKGYINWWEDICVWLTRSSMKQKTKKEIQKTISDEKD